MANITPQRIQERIEAAVNAMDAGDWAGALVKLETARTLMSGLPRFSLVKSEIEYTPEQLDAQIDRVRRLANRQAGSNDIVNRPVERVNNVE